MFLDETDITEWVCTQWEMAVGEYSLRCRCQEKPRNTHTLIVDENGVELEREIIKTSGPEEYMLPFQAADRLKAKYEGRFYTHYLSQGRRGR